MNQNNIFTIDMTVYETRSHLLSHGVISGHYMILETAYVKFGYVLGYSTDYNEIKSLMAKDLAGEISICE